MALKFGDVFKKVDLDKATDIAAGVKGSIASIFDRKQDVEDVDSQAECIEIESVDTSAEAVAKASKLLESAHELQEKVSQFVANNGDKLKQWYSDNKLDEKIKKVVKKAGAMVIYPVMMLYNLMKSPNTPVKDKALIVAPLAYFIFPADMIPDVFAGIGYVDDGVAIMASLKSLASSITPEIQEETKQQYIKIVGENDTAVIDKISKVVQDNQDAIIDSISEAAKETKKR